MERGVREFMNHEAMKFANSAITLQAVRSGTEGYTGEENLTDWLKAHQTALLEAVLEEVRGKKLGTDHLPKEGMSIDESIEFSLRTGNNIALQDIETIINKAIGV